MKSVKSLLLGSAAALVAVVGAQAADLPGKAAAPVEYVKVCSAYGAGFYFIPGTDTCLRVGGYVRADYYVNYNAGGGEIRSWDRATALTSSRARAVLDLDARSATEYGTLRSYARFGAQNTTISAENSITGNNAIYLERAFVQLGGLTAGYLQSFYDYFTGFSYATLNGGSNRWNTVLAYTAQFGGGISGTIALEDGANRRTSVRDLGAGNAFVTSTVATSGTGYGGEAMPDVVGNIRVDQSWGSAQLSAALHQVRSAYFAPALGVFVTPDSEYGWAIQGGVTINLPMLAAGDQVVVQAAYADGAIDYVAGFNSSPTSPTGRIAVTKGGNAVSSGLAGSIFNLLVADGYYNSGNIETTQAWNVTAAFRHFWTPTLRTAVFGTYTDVNVPGSVYWASVAQTPSATQVGVGADFKFWQVGANTIWSPVRNLDIGVEVLYTKIDPKGSKDFDTWGGMLRFQRNF